MIEPTKPTTFCRIRICTNQKELMHLTREKGQKLLATFAQFMHIMHTLLIMHELEPWLNAEKH